jgi:hypothetical protein
MLTALNYTQTSLCGLLQLFMCAHHTQLDSMLMQTQCLRFSCASSLYCCASWGLRKKIVNNIEFVRSSTVQEMANPHVQGMKLSSLSRYLNHHQAEDNTIRSSASMKSHFSHPFYLTHSLYISSSFQPPTTHGTPIVPPSQPLSTDEYHDR